MHTSHMATHSGILFSVAFIFVNSAVLDKLFFHNIKWIVAKIMKIYRLSNYVHAIAVLVIDAAHQMITTLTHCIHICTSGENLSDRA